MRVLLVFWFVMTSFQLISQASPEDIVHSFFQAMEDIDTLYLDDLIMEDAILCTSILVDDNNSIVKATKIQFLRTIAESNAGDLDEQVSNLKVQSEGGVANVWMDYSFYYLGKLSHCGVNNFSMVQKGGNWKIISLTDSRRKTNCTSHEATLAINEMLDNWHNSATIADSTAYFDLMTTSSVYVGSDPAEVWSKREFLSFASPYFAKGKAWAFTKVERNIYSKDYVDIAWFDEVLDTWMGPCRGSGVVTKDDNGNWKVQHYVLSVAVANDDIQDYLKVIGGKEK